MSSPYSTVWLLAAVNAVALSAVPMTMLIGSIIGAQLAPSERWATLPITAMVVGTACGVIPAARGMQRLGRRRTFALFLLIGAAACLLASAALAIGSFALFSLSAALLGAMAAAMQQIRFAAMESVALHRGPTAASIIMLAGIGAAIIGPELALLGRGLTAIDYQGSYWLGAATIGCAALLLLPYRPAPMTTQAADGGRPARGMLASPALVLAIGAGASAFMVMSFVMTATPVSMHLHHGHSLDATKWVIQSHIAAMFLPSLLTAWLFSRVGMRGLMAMGLACYTVTIVIGLLDVSVAGFWGQLVLLGVGWNFLFVSGTALLPTTYGDGEQFRAQALNDSVVFTCQAAASLTAGLAVSLLPWHGVLLLCLVPMAAMAALLAWERRRN